MFVVLQVAGKIASCNMALTSIMHDLRRYMESLGSFKTTKCGGRGVCDQSLHVSNNNKTFFEKSSITNDAQLAKAIRSLCSF